MNSEKIKNSGSQTAENGFKNEKDIVNLMIGQMMKMPKNG